MHLPPHPPGIFQKQAEGQGLWAPFPHTPPPHALSFLKMTEKKSFFNHFQSQINNSTCHIEIPNSKAKLIDLILFVTVLILPIYSRLVIAVLIYWINVRNQHTQNNSDMSIARCSSCISLDSGVDTLSSVIGSTSPSLPDEECPPSSDRCQTSLTPQNDELTWADPPSGYVDSCPDQVLEFNHQGFPETPPDMNGKMIKQDSNFSTDLRTESEILQEFNDDLSILIDKAGLILTERRDGTLKSSRENIMGSFIKLKEASRHSRNTFKRTARKIFSIIDAEAVIHGNTSMKRNLCLLEEIGDQLSKMDMIIKNRGLNLAATPNITIKYPTFNGETLPLIHTFLTEIEDLLIQAGVPLSGRGAVLANSIKGHAKFILRHSFLETNPSFQDQATILRNNFEDSTAQMMMIEKWHRKHGPINMSHLVTPSLPKTYNIVGKHITLIKATKSLRENQKNGDNSITHHYLDLIEGLLPRYKRQILCDARGQRKLSTDERFEQLEDTFEKIHAFLSMETIRDYGLGKPESVNNLKLKPPNPFKINSKNLRLNIRFPFDPSVKPPSLSPFLAR